MDLARLELGLLVAVMLPRTFPGMNKNHLASLIFTTLYSAYAVFPAVHGWRSWTLWSLTILIGIGRTLFRGPRQSADIGEKGDGPLRFRQMQIQLSELWLMLLRFARSGNLLRSSGFLLLFAASLLFFLRNRAIDVVRELVANDAVSVVLSGLLASSFVGQELVVPLLRPFAQTLSAANENLDEIGHTSAYIGWIERAPAFAFVAGGQSAAAALAITAKTLVRIPDLDKHPKGFVEYVLIGTLASLLVALTVAVAVRLALGLSPI